jgi:hypothetical protein
MTLPVIQRWLQTVKKIASDIDPYSADASDIKSKLEALERAVLTARGLLFQQSKARQDAYEKQAFADANKGMK